MTAQRTATDAMTAIATGWWRRRVGAMVLIAASVVSLASVGAAPGVAAPAAGEGQARARVGVAPPPRTNADNERMLEALGVGPGSTVAEIGAGAGAMTITVAHRVGDTGHVYSSELGDQRLRDLRKAVADAGVSNVTVVTGDPNQADLPDQCCDALYMQNVYHHFANPSAMNASLLRSLKPGGRLAVMDFAPRNGTTAPPAERADDGGKHGVTAETVRDELVAAGFEFVSSEPHREQGAFLVVMRKPR